MGRTIGVAALLRKNYKTYELPEEWEAALGNIGRPFRWLVYGKPKNGKTSLLLKFGKMMAQLGHKVYYNSVEEGASRTMQEALIRHGFEDLDNGKFMLGDRDTYAEMFVKIKKLRARVVIIDSRDYIKLTTDQYKKLIKAYPLVSFVIVCWEQAGKPLGKYAKDMEFMVDMVTHVNRFKAITNGRYGANLKYTVWEGAQSKYQLF